MVVSKCDKCGPQAQERQEAARASSNNDEGASNLLKDAAAAGSTDLESSLAQTDDISDEDDPDGDGDDAGNPLLVRV